MSMSENSRFSNFTVNNSEELLKEEFRKSKILEDALIDNDLYDRLKKNLLEIYKASSRIEASIRRLENGKDCEEQFILNVSESSYRSEVLSRELLKRFDFWDKDDVDEQIKIHEIELMEWMRK